MGRLIVLILFLAAIIFFLLPWASISCMGTDLVTASGFDLVRGSYNTTDFSDLGGLGDLGDFGDVDIPSTTSTESEPIAIYVLIAAGVGLIMSIFRGGIFRALRVVAGLAGVGLMIWLYFHIKGEIPADAQAFIQINLLIGAYLTTGALALAAILSLILKDSPPKYVGVTPTPTQAGPPPSGAPPPQMPPPPPRA